MPPRRTHLASLFRERRESLGYSRLRLGELVGIKPATLEAWELGRVAKPPIHDVLRLARFLDIGLDEIESAVLAEDASPSYEPRRAEDGVVPLLGEAIRLLQWTDADAAVALHTTPGQIRAWRSGAETMPLPYVMTIAAILGLQAAAALHPDARVADLAHALADKNRRATTPQRSRRSR